MSKILGKNVSVSVAVNASPQELELIGCARNCTFTTTVTTAPCSTVGSGVWQEFKALSNGWTVQVDGFATVDENANTGTLRQLQWALTPVVIVFQEVASSITIYYSGYAIITSVAATGNYADAETYSIQFLGTGNLQSSTNFRICGEVLNVSDGTVTLTFCFDDVEGATAYTIRVRDLTANTTTNYTNGPSPVDIDFDSSHEYAFSLKAEPDGQFGTEIFWP